MNSCKSQELLNSIDSTLTTSNSELSGINLSSTTQTTTLNNINTSLDNIETDVSAIKSDVDSLTKTKVIFNARLSDGSNNYLAKADYSSSPIDFYWQNDKNTPAYIYKYVFTYPEANEPTESQLYHSTAWASKIGALNSAETDYEAPYITVNDNKDYMSNISAGAPKNSWATNTCFVFQKDFHNAPIEIGISRKFAHYINANINTNSYDEPPVGIIEGYYFAS